MQILIYIRACTYKSQMAKSKVVRRNVEVGKSKQKVRKGRGSKDGKHTADMRHGKIEGSGSKETRPSDDAKGYNIVHY